MQITITVETTEQARAILDCLEEVAPPAAAPESASLNGNSHAPASGKVLGQFESKFRLDMMRNNPHIATLLAETLPFLQERFPEARLKQGKSAINFRYPDGRQAGIRPQPRGIRFQYQRRGQASEFYVQGRDDLEALAAWLATIPEY